MNIPLRTRKPPESPNASRAAFITKGSTKEPIVDPEKAIPEAVALYLIKYWLIRMTFSVTARPIPKPVA